MGSALLTQLNVVIREHVLPPLECNGRVASFPREGRGLGTRLRTRRRMHSIFGERERANWSRMSTLTCAASLVSAASQSCEAPPSSGFSAI